MSHWRYSLHLRQRRKPVIVKAVEFHKLKLPDGIPEALAELNKTYAMTEQGGLICLPEALLMYTDHIFLINNKFVFMVPIKGM